MSALMASSSRNKSQATRALDRGDLATQRWQAAAGALPLGNRLLRAACLRPREPVRAEESGLEGQPDSCFVSRTCSYIVTRAFPSALG